MKGKRAHEESRFLSKSNIAVAIILSNGRAEEDEYKQLIYITKSRKQKGKDESHLPVDPRRENGPSPFLSHENRVLGIIELPHDLERGSLLAALLARRSTRYSRIRLYICLDVLVRSSLLVYRAGRHHLVAEVAEGFDEDVDSVVSCA
jgi:hypothetical protein